MKRTLLKRIAVDPKVILGRPVIRGTRITVELILEKLAADRVVEAWRGLPHWSKAIAVGRRSYIEEVQRELGPGARDRSVEEKGMVGVARTDPAWEGPEGVRP